jgi:hypothetical protein
MWPPREGQTELNYKKPEKKDVIDANYAYADIDNPDVQLAPFIEDDRKPTFVIWSGNGIQPHYCFDEPVRVRIDGELNQEKLAEVEEVNAALSIKWDGDNTHNIERLCRMPWTINFPTKKKLDSGKVPVEAKLLWGPEGSGAEMEYPGRHTYPFETFERKKPKSQSGARSRIKAKGTIDLDQGQMEAPPGYVPLDDVLENGWWCSPLEDLYNYPGIKDVYGNDSRDLVCGVITWGFDPDEPLKYARSSCPDHPDLSTWLHVAL